MPVTYVGALARIEAMQFGYEHWALVTRWQAYEDGLVVAKTDMGWVIVREPQRFRAANFPETSESRHCSW